MAVRNYYKVMSRIQDLYETLPSHSRRHLLADMEALKDKEPVKEESDSPIADSMEVDSVE